MTALLAPDALYAAFKTGDIPTLEACFSQSRVRANVDAAEAVVASNTQSGTLILPYGELMPWFFLPPSLEPRSWVRTTVLELALTHGQDDTVRWLFSPIRDAVMGAILTGLLRFGVLAAVKANGVEILEFLLNTKAWHRMETKQRQSALDRMVCSLHGGSDKDMIALLLAHGANVNDDHLDMACDGSITRDQVDLLAAPGFFWVGCDLLVDTSYRTRRVHFGKNPDAVRQLVRVGVDCGKTTGRPLHRAAKEGDHVMVKLLLEEGCVDVDACNKGQQTALMMVTTGLGRSHSRQGLPIVTQLLLDAGADVTRKDCQDMTALRHAYRNHYYQDVESILEAHEAKVNALK